jgi:hyperosmotically inducible periplasmic protein
VKRFLIGLIVGVALGAWGHWFLEQGQNKKKLGEAKGTLVTRAEKMGGAIQEKVAEIRTDDIKRELEHSGMVVREKAVQAGNVISDATANARTTAAIKTKLFAEPGVSAMNINVDTSEGLVTLSGTVASHEEVAKAVKIAMEADGAQKVISTLQVKAK